LALWPGLTATAFSQSTAPLVGIRSASTGTTTGGEGYTVVDGTKAGALYTALRPDDWNGHLVLLLHGAVPPSEPVELPPFGHEPLWSDLIDQLVSDGYGVAYSSYRVNGLAVREGMIDTRVAQAMFTAAFGKPDDTYLVGLSMGTHIGQKLIETSHARYDGFLAICSGLGGLTLQTEYFVNARILFDYYFPGALPGNVWSETDLDFASVVLPAVVDAVTANPEAFQRAVEMAGIDQLAIPWTTPEELVTGIALALLVAGGGTGDLQTKAGGIVIDNMETRYTGSSDDIALNAGVGRFVADPNAVQYLGRFDPTGTLRGTPVLALHTTRDPAVQHQIHFPAYQDVLAEAGNQHLFETRLIDRFGHCAVSADEVVDSFDDLVRWAETGATPQP
jgi:pimeloyl-ACP methyl ester carboxylesterase